MRARARVLLLLAMAGSLLLGLPSAMADEAQSVQVVGSTGRDIEFLVYLDPGVEVTAATPLSSQVVISGTDIPSEATVQESSVEANEAVIVMDTSGSMRGDQIDAARKAAIEFVNAVPDDVRVGLVTFDGRVSVDIQPTTNKAQVIDAIGAIQAGGKTALYDGILTGLELANPAEGARLVLLSDGGDTASAATLQTVQDQVAGSGVPVDVIALAPSVAHAEILKGMANDSGGQFLLATGAAGLGKAFDRAAGSFGTRISVIASVPPQVNANSTYAVVNVTANGVEYNGTVKTPRSTELEGSGAGDAPAPLPSAAPTVAPVPVAQASSDAPWLYGILAALIIVVLALTVVDYRRKERQYLRTQQVLWYTTATGTGPKPDFAQHSLIQTFDDWRATKKGYAAAEAQLLTAALSFTPGSWILVRVGVCVVLVALISLIFGNLLIGLVVGALIGWLGTRAYLNSRINKRRQHFENELPDFLLLIASALRSGLSFLQALDSTAMDGQGEVSRQIRRAIGEVQMGSTVEAALTRVADRMHSDDLRWTVTAVAIQREVGGNLSTILDTAAATVKSRAELRREVRTLSAEGRLSGWVLAALPVGLFLYMLIANREYVSFFWTKTAGIAALVVIFVVFTLGFIWMRRIVRIEV